MTCTYGSSAGRGRDASRQAKRGRPRPRLSPMSRCLAVGSAVALQLVAMLGYPRYAMSHLLLDLARSVQARYRHQLHREHREHRK
jgi:hypothetical protein